MLSRRAALTIDDTQFDSQALQRWLREHHRQLPSLGPGNQGQVLLYETQGRRYVVKFAKGHQPARWLRQWMLRREYRVYQRLQGLAGTPRCYGLIDGRYLLLEYIEGNSFRAVQAQLRQDPEYFAQLWSLVHSMHARGVAHTDLKRKDNLMVRRDGSPCIIDFGAAIMRKPGFAPINHYIYRIAQQFDYNACIKLRHKGYQHLTPEEQLYYRRTPAERLTYPITQGLRRIARRLRKS